MKIAICDDSIREREQIKNYCLSLGYNNLSLYTSGEELLADPDLTSFNLLFLDIEMGEMSGIDVKRRLEHMIPSIFIVFTTSHQDLMQEAFGHNVISFLTKPFTERSIKQCIHKAACLSKDFFPIEINEQITLPCQDIIYLQAEHKYTVFHTINGNTYSSRIPLKSWYEKLTEFGFSPISRQAGINLKYYQEIKNRYVLLSNGDTLPVSRRHLTILEENFKSYMRNMMR